MKKVIFIFFLLFLANQILAQDLFLNCKIDEKRKQLTETFEDIYDDLELKKFSLNINLLSKNNEEFLITADLENFDDYSEIKFRKFIGKEHTQDHTFSNQKDLIYYGAASQHFEIEVSSDGQAIANVRAVDNSDKIYDILSLLKLTYMEVIIIYRETGKIHINSQFVKLNDRLLPTDEHITPWIKYVGTCKKIEKKTLF